jgi:hypothetical protein
MSCERGYVRHSDARVHHSDAFLQITSKINRLSCVNQTPPCVTLTQPRVVRAAKTAVPRASGDAVPRCGSVLLPPFEGRLKGKRLAAPNPVPYPVACCAGMAVRISPSILCLTFGQLGDGIELLFESGRRPSLVATGRGLWCVRVCDHVITDQRFNRSAEQLGETGEHRHRHPPPPDLIGSELGLRDGEAVGS